MVCELYHNKPVNKNRAKQTKNSSGPQATVASCPKLCLSRMRRTQDVDTRQDVRSETQAMAHTGLCLPPLRMTHFCSQGSGSSTSYLLSSGFLATLTSVPCAQWALQTWATCWPHSHWPQRAGEEGWRVCQSSAHKEKAEGKVCVEALRRRPHAVQPPEHLPQCVGSTAGQGGAAEQAIQGIFRRK